MSSGFVYAFQHLCSPANTSATVRVKVGRSSKFPWGALHEQRGEKLAFGFDLFGFERPIDVFEPFQTNDCKAAESHLKQHMRKMGWEVDPRKRGRSTEVFDVPKTELHELRQVLEQEL